MSGIEIKDRTRLYSYIVAYDGGSAPNPFNGVCSLALCKPAIRRTANVGDVIVGLGCGSENQRLVYVMQVEEKLTWDDYILRCRHDPALRSKIPKGPENQGDCIWVKLGERDYRALPSSSQHSGEEDMQRDVLDGQFVLLSRRYWYFGKGDRYDFRVGGADVPGWQSPGRGHRSSANDQLRSDFARYFNGLVAANGLKPGVHGTPAQGPGQDDEVTRSRCRATEREADRFDEEH